MDSLEEGEKRNVEVSGVVVKGDENVDGSVKKEVEDDDGEQDENVKEYDEEEGMVEKDGEIEVADKGGGKKKKKAKKKEKENNEAISLIGNPTEADRLLDKKKNKPPKDDDIKTHMANERTFFKWLFFGFHIGAMGTFILTFFSPSTPGRVWLVLGVWLVAFFFIYYGLFRYFLRRRALRLGLRDPTDWDDPLAPALMSGALFLVVIVIIGYAIVTDSVPKKGAWKSATSP